MKKKKSPPLREGSIPFSNDFGYHTERKGSNISGNHKVNFAPCVTCTRFPRCGYPVWLGVWEL